MTYSPIKILLLDDQRIFLQSLEMALGMDDLFEIVGAVTKGSEALKIIKSHPVDILVMDIAMPEQSGMAVFETIKSDKVDIKVISMSGLMQMDAFASLWEDGVQGIVHKSDPLDILLYAIDRVSRGMRYVSPSLQERMLELDENVLKLLTKREKQVLLSIIAGKSNKEAAEDLGVHVTTIRTHRENLMSKIDAHSTAEVIHFALRHGLMADYQTVT
ncbi:response regulator transcription factor [Temperatibacter marinus]|uniref:Response regulator transcription factor n=1 Tax=Temperatibacter marinus TaxID=1456591 RepID=A0AA52EJ17_9PROT|nr:response regulator transcription factor [Temperatibacter marinus]WND03432.1 response regulator transcription factor [Temperatibacter marinus]